MTPNEKRRLADYLREHPDATPQEARRAILAERPTVRLLPLAESLRSTEATLPDPQPPAAIEGLEGLAHSDLRIPQLKLRQPRTTRAAGVAEGDFFLAGDPTSAAPARTLALLELRRERRVLLPFEDGPATDALLQRIERKTGLRVPPDWQGPVCSSRDRVQPTPQAGIELPAVRCAHCALARWRTEDGRRSQDCAEVYRLLVFDLERQLPAVFLAKGSAIRPVRELLTQLQVAGQRHRRPAFGFWFEVTSAAREERGETYYVPVFTLPSPLGTAEQVAQLAAVRAACGAGAASARSA
ncbi:MAG: hypothetical protein R3F62_23330 [Planctomycetota bacterium]